MDKDFDRVLKEVNHKTVYTGFVQGREGLCRTKHIFRGADNSRMAHHSKQHSSGFKFSFS